MTPTLYHNTPGYKSIHSNRKELAMSTYHHLFFDLDNTLLDFDRSQIEAFNFTCRAFNLPCDPHTFQEFQIFNHTLWTKLEKGLITKDTLLSRRFSDFFEPKGYKINGKIVDAHFRQALSQSPYTVPHAKYILTELKRSGFLVYAASNGVSLTQIQRLKKSHLYPYFDDFFISEEIGYEKPSIHFFTEILRRLDMPPIETCLMIGDRLSSDIQGANQIGMDSVWYHPQSTSNSLIHPTYSIQNLLDLLPILGIKK